MPAQAEAGGERARPQPLRAHLTFRGEDLVIAPHCDCEQVETGVHAVADHLRTLDAAHGKDASEEQGDLCVLFEEMEVQVVEA